MRGRLHEEFGSDFARYPKAFYISDHTTAGYLDGRIAEVLEHDGDNIRDYLQVFQRLFPPEAGYVHDELSTPCSALWARCVRPSFIFAIFASGSCGDFHSLFDVFLFFRDRSNRARSARVGVSTPDASANRRMNASWDSPVSRRSMLRIAAFASSVVASMPTVFPRAYPFWAEFCAPAKGWEKG